MTDDPTTGRTQDIVVEEVFPHAPEMIWKALTTGALISRWMMEPAGFAPVVGQRFTFSTTPAGEWDGTIHCEVLEVVPNQRFAYSWKGGHETNKAYGSRLDTTITFTLTPIAEGTRLRLVHAGFVLPMNATAFDNLDDGWTQCFGRLGAVAAHPH